MELLELLEADVELDELLLDDEEVDVEVELDDELDELLELLEAEPPAPPEETALSLLKQPMPLMTTAPTKPNEVKVRI